MLKWSWWKKGEDVVDPEEPVVPADREEMYRPRSALFLAWRVPDRKAGTESFEEALSKVAEWKLWKGGYMINPSKEAVIALPGEVVVFNPVTRILRVMSPQRFDSEFEAV